MNSSVDKAGREYWDRFWSQYPLPPALDPEAKGLGRPVWWRFHQYFQGIFNDRQTRGKKLLEVGCGGSVFLPYFAKSFGFEVSGIDYSPLGCEKALWVLEREGVRGRVYCADFHAPPQDWLEQFDVVISLGVVEHFEDTAGAIRAVSRFLGAGGILITIIPNMSGLMGWLQRRLDKSAYDVHVALDREDLASYHSRAGLEVDTCEYFLPVYLGVLNVDSWPKSLPYRSAFRLGTGISRALRVAIDYLPFVRPNRWTSPFITCVARKPLQRTP